jgi:hypothetical protein
MTVRSTPRWVASSCWLPGRLRAAEASTWYPRGPPGTSLNAALAALA